MRYKFILLFVLIGFLIQSCSVQVKEKRSSTFKDTYKPKTVVKNENKEKIESKTSESNNLKKEVLIAITEEDKNFVKKEASALSMQIPDDKDIDYFIDYFTTTKKYFTENALKRANYFMPMVKKIFRQEGLPEELAYLAVVESGFNPFATSSANAAGIWQFIPSTGRRFGLRIDDYIDERRDPYKSTIAAAKYLKTLYNMFGSWELAIAAYNCGEKCVAKRLESSSAISFSEIKDILPSQTKEYVPRFFAILLIANNPEKYGLDVKTNIYDVINFTADREINLNDLAQEKKVDYDILKFYNAHLKKDIAFEGININLPKLDYAATFDRRFITTQPIAKNKTSENRYVAKTSNPKPSSEPAQTIVSQTQPAKSENNSESLISLIKTSEKPEIVKTSYKPSSNKENIYIVQKGDTLFSIARKFGVSVDVLKNLNNLEDENIKAGQELLIP
ncbi:lytic transglycosylase domain-containing protein [Sulfurihydrogenibium sp.]|jgi:membrane-bound lytic murein transglycosylase D|uniref:lytic transglycosylase domain-containing protein n=1 Tax=Sulfurihydrogenibium sp. TaxID=2053621 RepID=UPI002617BDE9|nr:lytic transglycosylase domain-containing protein [Sulfurihydrogenibium sp.]